MAIYTKPLPLDGNFLDLPLYSGNLDPGDYSTGDEEQESSPFWDALKGLGISAATRYISSSLPDSKDKSSDATLEIARLNAATQAEIAKNNAKAGAGISANTLLIVGAVVSLGVVFIIFRGR